MSLWRSASAIYNYRLCLLTTLILFQSATILRKGAHGKTDVRGITAADLGDRAPGARERPERAGRVETPEESDDEGLMLIPGTPSHQIAGESQGGTTTIIDLPVRTPKRPRAA